jgi:DNA-binding LacI/PurR family transcriptional regulator
LFRVEEARAASRRLLAERPETTALIVGNNLMTVGTLGMLRTAGLAVPHCISLVQLDDPVWASLVDPPLTSFAQPVRNMAQSAIDLLLERIRNKRPTSKHIVYQFEPRLRESVRSMS